MIKPPVFGTNHRPPPARAHRWAPPNSQKRNPFEWGKIPTVVRRLCADMGSRVDLLDAALRRFGANALKALDHDVQTEEMINGT